MISVDRVKILSIPLAPTSKVQGNAYSILATHISMAEIFRQRIIVINCYLFFLRVSGCVSITHCLA